MEDQTGWRFPWGLFWAEFVGTAILLLGGLSLVIFMFGEGNPFSQIVPSVELRRVINGFLFGSIGASIALSPVLYAIMVPLEAPLSGTSTNPARSFGPAIISGEWNGWWIYLAGPVMGSFIALFACSRLAKRIEVAKLYHFDTEHSGVIHKMTGRAQA